MLIQTVVQLCLLATSTSHTPLQTSVILRFFSHNLCSQATSATRASRDLLQMNANALTTSCEKVLQYLLISFRGLWLSSPDSYLSFSSELFASVPVHKTQLQAIWLILFVISNRCSHTILRMPLHITQNTWWTQRPQTTRGGDVRGRTTPCLLSTTRRYVSYKYMHSCEQTNNSHSCRWRSVCSRLLLSTVVSSSTLPYSLLKPSHHLNHCLGNAHWLCPGFSLPARSRRQLRDHGAGIRPRWLPGKWSLSGDADFGEICSEGSSIWITILPFVTKTVA